MAIRFASLAGEMKQSNVEPLASLIPIDSTLRRIDSIAKKRPPPPQKKKNVIIISFSVFVFNLFLKSKT